VIAFGGLASMQDIHDLLKPGNAGLEGAITGRALYDGRLDTAAALALLAGVSDFLGPSALPLLTPPVIPTLCVPGRREPQARGYPGSLPLGVGTEFQYDWERS
jgi:hypothetical protein